MVILLLGVPNFHASFLNCTSPLIQSVLKLALYDKIGVCIGMLSGNVFRLEQAHFAFGPVCKNTLIYISAKSLIKETYVARKGKVNFESWTLESNYKHLNVKEANYMKLL